jgi:RNA 2',3'-cyclic 3'-phosphodiesterase
MAELPQKIRAFIAIRVSPEVQSSIENAIAKLRASDDGIKWASSENLHLTLKFLGPAVLIEKIHSLDRELKVVAAETEAFEVEATGVGGFPNLERPRVLWIGLASDALIDLAHRIEAAAERCGFPREDRAFNPHLTISRLKTPRLPSETRANIESARERKFGTSTIREMTLYRSLVTSKGSIYEVLSKFPFNSPS